MKKLLLVIVFLMILCTVVFAQSFVVRRPIATAGSSGPNTWYWAFNLDDTAFATGYYPDWDTSAGGSVVTVAQAGTATKLAAKVASPYSDIDMKLGLYSSSNVLLASCTTTILSASGIYWAECNINQAVTATTYKVVMAGANGDVRLYYQGGQAGFWFVTTYAAMPVASFSPTADSVGYAVKLYVQ